MLLWNAHTDNAAQCQELGFLCQQLMGWGWTKSSWQWSEAAAFPKESWQHSRVSELTSLRMLQQEEEEEDLLIPLAGSGGNVLDSPYGFSSLSQWEGSVSLSQR